VPDSNDIEVGTAALARDRTSGATALARRAVRLLGAAARDDGKTLARWQQRVRTAGMAVAAAQPAMASLLALVDRVFRTAECATTPAAGACAVRRVLARFLACQPASLSAAARRGAGALPRRARCLTLSSSEVVTRTLLAAHGGGRLSGLVVAESRPGREGVATARRLAARGVPAVVVVDALAPAMVASVDAVVVGADAVTATAVWNKCGTFPLALAAKAAGRPLLVVTTQERVVGPRLARLLRVPDAEPRAVLRSSGAPLRAVSRLFDVTPLGLVTRVVTDTGSFTPGVLRHRLATRAASGWWRRLRPAAPAAPRPRPRAGTRRRR
jgi:translation initiation factor 2B subunit (eIF-2B alpha/beta/delta family)